MTKREIVLPAGTAFIPANVVPLRIAKASGDPNHVAALAGQVERFYGAVIAGRVTLRWHDSLAPVDLRKLMERRGGEADCAAVCTAISKCRLALHIDDFTRYAANDAGVTVRLQGPAETTAVSQLVAGTVRHAIGLQGAFSAWYMNKDGRDE